jgi:3'-5' exonuclease
MKPSVIVWDLETVPDLGGFAAANDLVGNMDGDIRAVLGNRFPKHIYHTIVCIGALVAHRESDHWAVDALGAPHVGERTEKQLISAFCEKIAELTPQLVTFNGNTFDLPVLRYRAMIHGISAPGLAARPYFNRYTEDAVDLCDILSSFAPHTKASLNELSKIMGMPGKPEGIDGTDVERYFLEGKISSAHEGEPQSVFVVHNIGNCEDADVAATLPLVAAILTEAFAGIACQQDAFAVCNRVDVVAIARLGLVVEVRIAVLKRPWPCLAVLFEHTRHLLSCSVDSCEPAALLTCCQLRHVTSPSFRLAHQCSMTQPRKACPRFAYSRPPWRCPSITRSLAVSSL